MDSFPWLIILNFEMAGFLSFLGSTIGNQIGDMVGQALDDKDAGEWSYQGDPC